MGIQDLGTFLSKNIGFAPRKEWASTLHGRIVAIDGHNIMHKNLYGAQKTVIRSTDVVSDDLDRSMVLNYWIALMVGLAVKFMNLGITPVFVFDGVSPIEKKQTKDKRSDQRQNNKDKIQKLKEEIAVYDPVSVPKSLQEEYKKSLTGQIEISRDEVDYLKSLLSNVGIPCIQAVGEAEQTCSMLCIDGIVDAVYTTDTDTYALGCPMVIRSIGSIGTNPHTKLQDAEIEVVRLSDILKALDLPYDSFLDFCILCGTDFNDRIPKCGPVSAYNLIKKHKRFEALDDKYKNGIDYVRVRKIFATVPHLETIHKMDKLEFAKDVPEVAREILAPLGDVMHRYSQAHALVPKPQSRGTRMDPNVKIVRLRIVPKTV